MKNNSVLYFKKALVGFAIMCPPFLHKSPFLRHTGDKTMRSVLIRIFRKSLILFSTRKQVSVTKELSAFHRRQHILTVCIRLPSHISQIRHLKPLSHGTDIDCKRHERQYAILLVIIYTCNLGHPVTVWHYVLYCLRF